MKVSYKQEKDGLFTKLYCNDQIILLFNDKQIYINSFGLINREMVNYLNEASEKASLGFKILYQGGKYFVSFQGQITPFRDGIKLYNYSCNKKNDKNKTYNSSVFAKS